MPPPSTFALTRIFGVNRDMTKAVLADTFGLIDSLDEIVKIASHNIGPRRGQNFLLFKSNRERTFMFADGSDLL